MATDGNNLLARMGGEEEEEEEGPWLSCLMWETEEGDSGNAAFSLAGLSGEREDR